MVTLEELRKAADKEDSEKFIALANAHLQSASIHAMPEPDYANLLRANFIIGDSHNKLEGKAWIMKNATALKKAGFDYMFFEHFSNQGLLDDFNNAVDGTDLPRGLLEEIKRIQHQDMEKTIKSCRAVGIKVVALDHEIHIKHPGQFGQGIHRTSTFNAMAHLTITKFMKDKPNVKYFALVGNSHVHDHLTLNVPGIANMLGIQGVWVNLITNKEDVSSVDFGKNASSLLENNERIAQFSIVINLKDQQDELLAYNSDHEVKTLSDVDKVTINPSKIALPEKIAPPAPSKKGSLTDTPPAAAPQRSEGSSNQSFKSLVVPKATTLDSVSETTTLDSVSEATTLDLSEGLDASSRTPSPEPRTPSPEPRTPSPESKVLKFAPTTPPTR